MQQGRWRKSSEKRRAGENCESRSGGWTLQSDSERQTPGNRSFLITVLPIINAHATTCWVESATTETPACLSTTRLINIAVSYLFLHTGSNSYSPYPPTCSAKFLSSKAADFITVGITRACGLVKTSCSHCMLC